MMKINWIVLASLGLLAFQANAENSVVIDSQMVGMLDAPHLASTASTSTALDVHAAPSGESSANDANRERALKSHKVSSQQSLAIAKEKLSETNVQSGGDFLTTNKAKKGVISLPSGVQYKILRAGKGKKPSDANVISCIYTGNLIDGTSFEKTDTRKPSALNVSGLVPGLKEAVKMMSAGSKWEIVVPPNLAYGASGSRGVGGNAVVIYTMEIVGVK
jgi:FKBP-type peptidyl-prolyl cis-trans isomerase FklB